MSLFFLFSIKSFLVKSLSFFQKISSNSVFASYSEKTSEGFPPIYGRKDESSRWFEQRTQRKLFDQWFGEESFLKAFIEKFLILFPEFSEFSSNENCLKLQNTLKFVCVAFRSPNSSETP
jgi:hypothetical protein